MSPSRQVARHDINGYQISTVELAGHTPIMKYETMIFDHESKTPWAGVYSKRYPKLEMAKAGHVKALNMIINNDIKRSAA